MEIELKKDLFNKEYLGGACDIAGISYNIGARGPKGVGIWEDARRVAVTKAFENITTINASIFVVKGIIEKEFLFYSSFVRKSYVSFDRISLIYNESENRIELSNAMISSGPFTREAILAITLTDDDLLKLLIDAVTNPNMYTILVYGDAFYYKYVAKNPNVLIDVNDTYNNFLDATAKYLYVEKELEKSKKELEANVDFTPQNIQLPEYGVSNYIEKVNFSQKHVQKYNEIVTKNAKKIKYLSSQYKNIFKNVNNGNLRNTSGNFNVNRYATKREQTLRYFDKRIAPTDKSDTSVLLLIDESGSMSGRMDDVKKHAIMIAESFISINIPIAVIGFNANMRTQESPEHTWYCDFDTSKINRYALAGIHSKYDNFDGYSIKYATEILSKRSSQNKLLIVISDGAPLCNYYNNRGRKINGYADTADAIRKAKEKVSTIGIHVGECDESIIFKLWGDAYITDKNDDISFALVNKLKTVVKKW